MPNYGEEPVEPVEPPIVHPPLPPFDNVEIVESTPTELIVAIMISGVGIALAVFFLIIFRKALCRWDKKRLGTVTPHRNQMIMLNQCVPDDSQPDQEVGLDSSKHSHRPLVVMD